MNNNNAEDDQVLPFAFDDEPWAQHPLRVRVLFGDRGYRYVPKLLAIAIHQMPRVELNTRIYNRNPTSTAFQFRYSGDHPAASLVGFASYLRPQQSVLADGTLVTVLPPMTQTVVELQFPIEQYHRFEMSWIPWEQPALPNALLPALAATTRPFSVDLGLLLKMRKRSLYAYSDTNGRIDFAASDISILGNGGHNKLTSFHILE